MQGHPDGFGFLVPDDGGEDLFLSPVGDDQGVARRSRGGARVGVDRRGRREGVIVEVLERANPRVVGRLHEEHGICFVVPEDQRISQDILIPREALERRRQAGQVVVAEIIEQPDRHVKPVGRVVEVLGNYADPGMEVEIALRKHDLPHVFSEPRPRRWRRSCPRRCARRTGGARGPARPAAGDHRRRDRQGLRRCGVTASREGKGFRLWVAIADVSHYVKHGDALDLEARERGNSVYFPRRVIPMLPEELSNGLCSLNPDVDRLCMVCEMVDRRARRHQAATASIRR